MKQLAILGHPTRGEEVIEILEMLGGKNGSVCKHDGTTRGWVDWVYIIDEEGFIDWDYPHEHYDIYTLEEFLEKFPYKAGDKVLYKIYNVYSSIKTMTWNEEKEQIIYRLDSQKLWVATADELKPYKEETMDKANKAVFDANAQCCDIMNHLIKEETMEGKIESFEILESHCADEVKIEFNPFNFEIVEKDNVYYVVKKKPQYPKTYEERCGVKVDSTVVWKNNK